MTTQQRRSSYRELRDIRNFDFDFDFLILINGDGAD
jgi:hypothetical protein